MIPDLQNDSQAVESVLQELRAANITSEEEDSNIRRELGRRSPLYAALSLYGNENAIWQHFAQERGMTFYTRHQELRIFMSDMLNFREALELGIMPHRPKIPFSEVLTYHIDIQDYPAREVAGSRARYSLITPTLFRYLYNMAYPEALTGKLSMSQARALVTFTHEGSWNEASPEQEAEIVALSRGYHYIDIRREPPEKEVRDLISMTVKARAQCYPHHLTGTHLVVMMQNPENEAALQLLRTHTQMKIQPVISTLDTIVKLIQDEQRERAEQTTPQLSEVSHAAY